MAIILYRDFDIQDNEHKAMDENFTCYNSRTQIPKESLIIGRYSVLPFYKELENDMNLRCCSLINTWEQHSFVADIGKWYPILKDYTPETWNMNIGTDNLPRDCSFVLKGATNSIKRLWSTHMYAATRNHVANVYSNLLDDTMIGQQEIFARRYVPLKRLGEAMNGMPVTEEYRFFICYGQIISGGYYWSSHIDDLISKPLILYGHNSNENDEKASQIKIYVNHIANTIGDRCNFYTIDIGITENGNPIVIELNDGQMAGLSENNPFIMYKNLKNIIKEK